jgi:hypothetical protein
MLSKGGLACYVDFRYRYIGIVIILLIIQIKGPAMPYSKSHQTHLSPAEEEAAENEDVKKLVNVVEDSLERIATITKLPLQEVMHVIEEVDVNQLMHATQEAVKNIAHATDLDSACITRIFKEDRTATVENIVRRLREESHVHRARW